MYTPSSCFSRSEPRTGRARQLAHTVQLHLQLFAARRSQSVSLFLARRVRLLEALDPLVFKQPPEGPIERACAQPHAAIAKNFNILHQRVPMPRPLGQAQQNQQDCLTRCLGVRSLHNMSHDDILSHFPNRHRKGALPRAPKLTRQPAATFSSSRVPTLSSEPLERHCPR